MKLSRIYTNDPARFAPIQFNGVTDDRISVIFATITKPKDPNVDSHNLVYRPGSAGQVAGG